MGDKYLSIVWSLEMMGKHCMSIPGATSIRRVARFWRQRSSKVCLQNLRKSDLRIEAVVVLRLCRVDGSLVALVKLRQR